MGRSFRFLKVLGEGAFGRVLLAEVRDDEDFVQTLAVKWLHPQHSHSTDSSKRLRDEARLLALLHHESIVRVHGLAKIEGRLAILMEPVDGADLGRVQELPTRAALEVCAAVADALDAAWNQVPPGANGPLRVVHRDIKPSNVMVSARGAVKVMDFGIAWASFEARETRTEGHELGTKRYMAPERFLEGVAGSPSDVFSLGVTLVELLTGRPWRGLRLQREHYQTDVSERLARVDHPELRGLVADMVAFEPHDRPSASDVHRRCLQLASAAEAPDLRSWAGEHVPALSDQAVHAALTGTVLPGETAPGAAPTSDWASLDDALSESTSEPLVAPTDDLWTVASLSAEGGHEAAPRRRQPLLALGLVGVALLALALGRWSSPSPVRPAAPAEPTLSAPPAQPVAPAVAVAPAPAAPEPLTPSRPEPAQSLAPVPARPKPAVAVPVPEDPPPPPEPLPLKTGLVVFSVAEGLTVDTDAGAIRERRRAVELPVGTATIAVSDGKVTQRCEIHVTDARTEVAIHADLSCAQ